MYKLIISALAIFGLVGCGTAPEAPSQVHKMELKAPTSIRLYSQTLTPSATLAKKVFKVVSVEGKILNEDLLEGEETSTAYIFSTPLHVKYTFDDMYILYKADISQYITLKDDTFAKHIVVADIKTMDVTYNNKKSALMPIKQTQDSINVLQKLPTKSVTFNINALYTDNDLLSERKFSVVGNEINATFSVYNPHYEHEIIVDTLSNRMDVEANEALLHAIAKKDSSYYYELRKQKEKYLLGKHSMLNMPDDADLSYASSHYKEFFNNGKYRTKEGKYKIIIAQDLMKFDNTATKVSKTHTIKTKYTKKRITKTTDIPDHDDFIDFSKGVN